MEAAENCTVNTQLLPAVTPAPQVLLAIVKPEPLIDGAIVNVPAPILETANWSVALLPKATVPNCSKLVETCATGISPVPLSEISWLAGAPFSALSVRVTKPVSGPPCAGVKLTLKLQP